MDRKQRIGLAAALFLLSSILVIYLATNGSSLLGEGTQDPRSPLNQAGILFETGANVEVMSRYVDSVGMMPILVADYANLDLHEYRPGMMFGPEIDIDSVKQIVSDLALAQANIAKSFHDQDRLKEGVPWAEEALRLDPYLPEANLVSGFLNFRLRNTYDAIDDFKRVIQLDPSNFDAYLYLGVIYNGRENPAQSIRYLNQALELSSTLEEGSLVLTHRAVAYSMIWRYDECFEDLDMAEALDPDNGWVDIARAAVKQAISMRQGLIPDRREVEEQGGSKQMLTFGNN